MRIIVTALLLVLADVPSISADDFEAIKARLSESPCTSFEFVSIVSSDLFDSVDSAQGNAYIANDGRFLITIADEQYLSVGGKLYSYSPANNQVVIEDAESASMTEELSFLIKLDDHYTTTVIAPDTIYTLHSKARQHSGLPDSIHVLLDGQGGLKSLDYRDVNGEPTEIVFSSIIADSVCDSMLFVPRFPDTADWVRMF